MDCQFKMQFIKELNYNLLWSGELRSDYEFKATARHTDDVPDQKTTATAVVLILLRMTFIRNSCVVSANHYSAAKWTDSVSRSTIATSLIKRAKIWLWVEWFGFGRVPCRKLLSSRVRLIGSWRSTADGVKSSTLTWFYGGFPPVRTSAPYFYTQRRLGGTCVAADILH